MKTKVKSTHSTLITIELEQVKRLHRMSSALLDVAEDILETQGLYSDKFLDLLAESEADVKAGRVYKVKSLTEGLTKGR